MIKENILNVFQYWGQGIENMPLFIKTIYKHNLKFCNDNDINLVLVDDNNVYDYIVPHKRYKTLEYNFKSDIIRYYILHKYGGFWFDTDVIIFKDLNKLYKSISNYECILDIEHSTRIGCCSLYIKKNSTVSKFCINYIDNILNKNKKLNWGDIGPDTADSLYKKYSYLIKLNTYETVKNGCNFICWNIDPGKNKKDWYLNSEHQAKVKADALKMNNSCYYLITWTIYRDNDIGDNLNNMVFNDKRSVFSYFIDYNKEKIIVENSLDSEWNGEYLEYNNVKYIKDNKHHIYLYNKIWKLGEYGVKVYKQLGNNINNTIDLSLYYNKIIINKPIVNNDTISCKVNFIKPKYAVMWASTVNIGDDIQTLAAINFLKKKGITKYSFIDREKLSDYNGEPVTLIMNGWYIHNINKFPPSNKITPVFISIHINNETLIHNNIKYFKRYEPIGCRDTSTVSLFKKYGIDAFFTGCLTLLFDDVKEKTEGKYLVDINTDCSYIPHINIDTSKYTDYQIIKHDIDKNLNLNDRLKIANNLLNKYRTAELVITTRLHCVLPCRAFNTKSIFIHKNYNSDSRFFGLKNIINGSNIEHSNEYGNRQEIENIKNDFLLVKLPNPKYVYTLKNTKNKISMKLRKS